MWGPLTPRHFERLKSLNNGMVDCPTLYGRGERPSTHHGGRKGMALVGSKTFGGADGYFWRCDRVVDLALNHSQTLVSPIFRSVGTICGFVSQNVFRGQICNLCVMLELNS